MDEKKLRPVSILLVEDEESILALLPQIVRGTKDHNREFHTASSVESAMHAIETGEFHAAIMDNKIHRGRSVDGIIQAFRKKFGPSVGMIMISADNSAKQMEVGGENCEEVPKPFGGDRIKKLRGAMDRMLKPHEDPDHQPPAE